MEATTLLNIEDEMKTFFGIAVGFMFVLALLGGCAFWVWMMTKFNISKEDVSIGAFLAMFVLVISFSIALKYT